MKKAVIFIVIIFGFLIFSTPKTAFAEQNTLPDVIDGQLSDIDFTELENFINANLSEYNIDAKSLIKDLITGNYSFNFSSFFSYLSSIFFSKIKSLIPTFIIVLSIAVLYKLLNEFSYFGEKIKSIVFYLCFSSVALAIFPPIITAVNTSYNSIKSLSNLSEIVSPIILSVMAVGGEISSTAIFSPFSIILSNIVTKIVASVVFPLVKSVIILSLVGGIFNEIKLDRLLKFINSLIKWILGITFTVFTAYFTILGITSGIIDGVSIKATKYAISNSIPIIGSYLSGGFNLVLGASVLIKNALGVGTLIFTIILTLSPLAFIIVLSLLLKFLAGLTDLISGGSFSQVLEKISDGVSLLITSVLGVVFSVFITIFTIISTANAFI